MSEETHTPERSATFREVFAVGEYRALLGVTNLAWLGDYLTKAAVAVLVYEESGSIALSAAAFAVSFIPWLFGGPLLTALADRYPYRAVMIICDLVRMALIAIMAIDGLPIPVIFALVFLATLAAPPGQAARSALLPLVLTGDRLVLGLSINASSGQAAQVAGYVIGAGIAARSPASALVLAAATFATSATIIRLGVRTRPAADTGETRRNLLRETGAGFQLIFGTPVLRAIAVLVFAAMLFAIVPEGLAAAWADTLSTGDSERGLAQALIMAAPPIGFIVGSLVIGRAVRPDQRRVLLRPFAVLAPLVLVPAYLNPPPPVVALLAAASGFAVAGLLPVANSLFVRALPHGYRARAFGVMNTGMQVVQGFAVLVTGLLTSVAGIPRVVGLWSLAGVLLMFGLVMTWPGQRQFDEAIAATAERDRQSSARPVLKPTQSAGIEPARAQPTRAEPTGARPPGSEAGVGAS